MRRSRSASTGRCSSAASWRALRASSVRADVARLVAASLARRGSFWQNKLMPFIDVQLLSEIERLPGWRGRYFDSENMTFAHYEFDAGASIHEHFHAQEEVWQIIEGEVEITIDGITRRVSAGAAGVVPSNVRHSVKALSSGKA